MNALKIKAITIEVHFIGGTTRTWVIDELNDNEYWELNPNSNGMLCIKHRTLNSVDIYIPLTSIKYFTVH